MSISLIFSSATEVKTIFIDEDAQATKILSFIEGLPMSEHKDPSPTQEATVEVQLIQGGIATGYKFTSETADGYGLVQGTEGTDGSWYRSSPEAYPYLLNLFRPANAPSSWPESVPAAPKAFGGISIEVKRSSLTESKTVPITDEPTAEKILGFVGSMSESDYKSEPSTGGGVIEVLLTQDGITKTYSFVDAEADGYGLAKDHQHPSVRTTWHFTDPEAYPYLSNLFE